MRRWGRVQGCNAGCSLLDLNAPRIWTLACVLTKQAGPAFQGPQEGKQRNAQDLPLLGPLLLAAAMLLPVANTGCTARVRVYDHSDYHNWDDREDRAYRRFLD